MKRSISLKLRSKKFYLNKNNPCVHLGGIDVGKGIFNVFAMLSALSSIRELHEELSQFQILTLCSSILREELLRALNL